MDILKHSQESNGYESVEINPELISWAKLQNDKASTRKILDYADDLARKIGTEFVYFDPKRSEDARKRIAEINKQFEGAFARFETESVKLKASLWSKLPFTGSGPLSELAGFKFDPNKNGSQEKPTPNSEAITANKNSSFSDIIAKAKIDKGGTMGKK